MCTLKRQYPIFREFSTHLMKQTPFRESECAGEDLNLHALRHTHLKRACLPIPAPALEQAVL